MIKEVTIEERQNSSLVKIKNGIKIDKGRKCIPAFGKVIAYKVSKLDTIQPNIHIEIEYYSDQAGKYKLTLHDGTTVRVVNLINTEVSDLSIDYLNECITKI